jgi:hypothetical protein
MKNQDNVRFNILLKKYHFPGIFYQLRILMPVAGHYMSTEL